MSEHIEMEACAGCLRWEVCAQVPFQRISFPKEEQDLPMQVLHHTLSRLTRGPSKPPGKPEAPLTLSAHHSPEVPNGFLYIPASQGTEAQLRNMLTIVSF